MASGGTHELIHVSESNPKFPLSSWDIEEHEFNVFSGDALIRESSVDSVVSLLQISVIVARLLPGNGCCDNGSIEESRALEADCTAVGGIQHFSSVSDELVFVSDSFEIMELIFVCGIEGYWGSADDLSGGSGKDGTVSLVISEGKENNFSISLGVNSGHGEGHVSSAWR